MDVNLKPDETELIGSWKLVNGRMVEDEIAKRIRTIVSQLRQVATSADGWQRLYEDPRDHRFWELSYPSSEMQGGGPPILCVVTDETLRKKYSRE